MIKFLLVNLNILPATLRFFNAILKLLTPALLFLMLINTGIAKGQTPTLIGSYTYSTKGAGVAGIPNFNWSIPAGKNRIMIVSAQFERDHTTFSLGANYPGINADDVPQLRVGTINQSRFYYRYNYYSASSNVSTTAYLSSSFFSYGISDQQNLPTGNTTFSFPAITGKPPLSAADDVVISIVVFENVNQSAPASVDIFLRPVSTTNFTTLTQPTPTAPIGTTTSNIVYLANAAISQETTLGNSTGWTDIHSVTSNNNAGTNYLSYTDTEGVRPSNEPDGVSLKVIYRSDVTASPSVTFSRTNSTKTLSYIGRMITLLPLARPSVSGTIYNDTNGPASIGGTGTGGGGLFVNAYDLDGNFIASTAVNATSGNFSFPAGNLIETYTYNLKLSKNQATLTNPNPLQELNAGWATVGESLSASGNDGLADGALLVSVAAANITGLRYGIQTCGAGTTAPKLLPTTNFTTDVNNTNSAYRIPCGATTANLALIPVQNKPSPATVSVTWHTATPATTANKLTNINAVGGTTKYYAAFYDSATDCYSPTTMIRVYAPICASDDNFSSLPLTSAGGTLPSIYANDSYNGATITSISAITAERLYELWNTAQATINDDGTLTIPPGLAPGTYVNVYKLRDKDPDLDGLLNDSQTATVTFTIIGPDADGDGIPDWQDLDDDNDGILDTDECPTTVNDFITAFATGTTKDILPSDFGLALNAKNQNVTADLSAKFGYPANSGAVIVNITNASVHPTSNVWWTKNGQQPTIWKVTGTMSAFVGMGNDLIYYANDSKSIHIYDNSTVIPITAPGLANQVPVAGQWSVTETQAKKTLNNLNTNSGTTENANWRYINMNFGPKLFGFSTTVAAGDPNYAVTMLLECDTDKDGIPNRLDLDSDNDGCFDAIEGDENVTTAQLNPNGSMTGTVNTDGVPNLVNAAGTADIGSDVGQGIGSALNGALKDAACYALSLTADAYSGNAGTAVTIPTILGNDTLNGATPVIGTTHDLVTISQSGTWPTGITLNTTTGGVNITAAVPAGIYTVNYQVCVNGSNPALCQTQTVTITITACTNLPNTQPATDFTKTGVSTLQGFANGWPNNVLNGFIAIESKTKGFVITRVTNTAAITTPVEGMLVYDKSASGVKLYYDDAWHCIQKNCN